MREFVNERPTLSDVVVEAGASNRQRVADQATQVWNRTISRLRSKRKGAAISHNIARDFPLHTPNNGSEYINHRVAAIAAHRDRDGEKGAYVINMVDEVTQYQPCVGRSPSTTWSPCSWRSSARSLPRPGVPRRRVGVRTASRRSEQAVEEFTKSRPRRSDNARRRPQVAGAQPHPGASGPAGQRLPARLPLPLPQPPPGWLFAIEVEVANGRTPTPEVPTRAGHDPVRETQMPFYHVHGEGASEI